MAEQPILSIVNLKTHYYLEEGVVKAVDGVSLDVYQGRITAIVGGSGSGKSVMSLSIFNLIDKPGKIIEGEIWLEGVNLRDLSEKQLLQIRGKEIAMIFQEPTSSLNPVEKIKTHLFEVTHTHNRGISKKEALSMFREVLSRVGLQNADQILDSYPFELSGGMCQRVMVAMGLLARAKVLIADEPTSSLDLTTQAAILEELVRLKDEGMAVVLITHDLGVVAQMADDVYVMKDGKIVDSGTVYEVFDRPRHDYTKSLLESIF
ncbi:ABC transporter ATP-binding protein [Desulfosporosinus meridiei]|uniref:ABC-type dipeptide/oligopeptide/nickel transport system, ATPase component n=1 Tax=Desulfosporosinus meridiei (strain ATCC BAA-275 / DSM 13257 / KCTC 12902 / NCIMB 13706 / S10) TaxID=768704 RepID=J7IQX6_DESMD|nr:ABC transporter ATP-binding protein [Desulfosporosinus meridiei]AFQ42584.1 ABC-type dipeptide/oligopeptide/nickel transport system, ATPase component [Desulfosporosinus meridiei DSM 13257]